MKIEQTLEPKSLSLGKDYWKVLSEFKSKKDEEVMTQNQT